MRPVGPPALLLLITSAQKKKPPVVSAASATAVLMVKLRSGPDAVLHWLDPPLDLQAMAMPFVKLNVLPFAAGAWSREVLTVLGFVTVPFSTENCPSVELQPFPDVLVTNAPTRGLAKPKVKLPPLPLAPVDTNAQLGASDTVMVVRPPAGVTSIVLPATIPQPAAPEQ